MTCETEVFASPGIEHVLCVHRIFSKRLQCVSQLRRGQFLSFKWAVLQVELDAYSRITGNPNHMGEVFPGQQVKA